jgi:aryl carrier-like protein
MPEKPFLRAAKGTVQRFATVNAYKAEIETLYRRSEEDGVSVAGLKNIDLSQDRESLERQLAALVEHVVEIESGGLQYEKDFFAAGMDSLHVMSVVKQLKAALVGVRVGDINTRLIYSNPTIQGLASALKALSGMNGFTNSISITASQEEKMEEALQNFIAQLPPSSSHETTQPDGINEQMVVLLTGSTGSLGSYLLHILSPLLAAQKSTV